MYSWIFTSFPQDSRMFQRLKKMKSWNLIKSTLNLNQIKTVNLDKKEKRKIERERENVIILSFADENIIIKVTCTNSRDMIALKTGHQNAFSVIHSMRLPVGKAWIVNMFESCGTPLFEGTAQPTGIRGLAGECWLLPWQLPAWLLLYQGRRRWKREKAGRTGSSWLK